MDKYLFFVVRKANGVIKKNKFLGLYDIDLAISFLLKDVDGKIEVKREAGRTSFHR